MYAYISEENKKKIYEAQKTYLIAKCYHETMEELENESKAKILTIFKFYDKDDIRVTDYRADYRIKESHWENFNKLVHNERVKRGFKVNPDYTYEGYDEAKPYNLTTTYLSWKLLREAENNLIDVAYETLPEHLKRDMKKEDIKNSCEYEKAFIDIVMKLDTGYKYNVKSILEEV